MRKDQFAYRLLEHDQETAHRLLSQLDMAGECWLWTGAHRPAGHGVMGIRRPDGTWTTTGPYRWVASILLGPVEGKDVDHLCRNPACVRPDHLEVVPHIVNLQRGHHPQSGGRTVLKDIRTTK